MENPFPTFLANQAAMDQKRYDAKYADDLANFNNDCATYQERAQHQYDVDGTILPPPAVPVKKTAIVDGNRIKEGTWTDPNLHAPVFTPVVAPKPTGLPDISKAVTLDDVMAALVYLAQGQAEIKAALKIS